MGAVTGIVPAKRLTWFRLLSVHVAVTVSSARPGSCFQTSGLAHCYRQARRGHTDTLQCMQSKRNEPGSQTRLARQARQARKAKANTASKAGRVSKAGKLSRVFPIWAWTLRHCDLTRELFPVWLRDSSRLGLIIVFVASQYRRGIAVWPSRQTRPSVDPDKLSATAVVEKPTTGYDKWY